jgi:hypothetical protein
MIPALFLDLAKTAGAIAVIAGCAWFIRSLASIGGRR